MHYFDKFLETAKNKGWVIEEAVEKIIEKYGAGTFLLLAPFFVFGNL